MPDTLTVSFCERCGSRHEFRAPNGLSPLRKTRGLLGGVKNFLVSDERWSEAVRSSMQEVESAVAAAQLDAFHATVHLCLNCRQYTCNDCWNGDAARCRTCAPIAGVDDLPIAAMAALTSPAAVPVFEHPAAEPLPAESWPTEDHEVYPAAEARQPAEAPEAPEVPEAPLLPAIPDLRIVAWEEDLPAAEEPVAEPAPLAAETVAEPPVVAEPVQPEPESLPQPQPVAAESEGLEMPLAASAEPVQPEPAAPVELAPAAEVQPPAPEPAPEPVVPDITALPAMPPPPPQPIASWAARRSGPMREKRQKVVPLPTARPAPDQPAPRRVAAEASEDEVAARRAQLAELGLDEVSEEPIVDAPQVVPYRSRGARGATPPTKAPVVAIGSLLWEASAKELGEVTVQSCSGCGLALAATARFCRRCGARQAQPA